MGTKSSTATTTIPSNVAANYNTAMARVASAAGVPYQRYSSTGSDFVAPLTSTQQSGVAGANTYANYAQPYYGEATDLLHGTMGQVNPYYGTATDYAAKSGQNVYAGGLDVNQYLNPYLQYTLGNTQALLNQSNQQAMAGQLGQAISQGAFGGDRAGIAAANLRQQQQLAEGKVYSDILSGGYDTAMGVAQKQQAQALAAAQADREAALAASQQYQGLGKDVYGMQTGMARQLAETGLSAQEAGLAGAKAQLEAGGVEQATEQATKDALIKQFMAEQGYPFQVAEFMADQYSKIGPLYGQTTRTVTKSDVRLKEDIKHIGKTFDGQPIYSYRFKDHPQTQIGLMAQEVEKHHPHAVSNDPDGYKSVDYAEATDHAAKRGHFATGGVIPSSQGGPVKYSNAGEGFAIGGTPYDLTVPGLGGTNPYETEEERRRRGPGSSGGSRPGLAPAPSVPEQPSASEKASQMAGTAANAMALASVAKGMMKPPATSLVKTPAVSGITNPTAVNSLGGGASLTPPSMASITNPAAVNSLGGGASLTPASMSSVANPAALNSLGGGASLTPAVTSGSALVAPGAAATAPTLGGLGAGLGHTLGTAGAGLGHAAGTALSAVPQALGAVGSGLGSAGTALAGGNLGAAAGAAGHGLLAGGSALAGGLGSAAAGAGSALAAGAAGVGSAIASAIPIILSFFSDERLKEDIKPVGKTFDGQTVYSYKYKGDDTTHMGMLAQEVEHHHPEAVGESHGYKTVNYKHATHEAAERGHFASGGLAGRDGYQDGGAPFTLSKEPLDEFGRPIKPGFLDPRPYLKNIGETVGQAADLTRRTLLPKATEAPISPLSYATGPIGAALGAGSDLAKLAFGKPVVTNPSATVPITGERPKETIRIDAAPDRPAGLAAGRPAARRTQITGGLSPAPVDATAAAPASAPVSAPPVASAPPAVIPEPSEATKALYSGAPISSEQTEPAGSTALGKIGRTAGDLGQKAVGLAKNIVGNPDILIPILAGLGAAGSSDTTDTLSKVSAGLTGGAEAMQGIREFKAKRALSEAQGAEAAANAAKAAGETAVSGGFVTLADGRKILKGVWLGMPEPRPRLADASAIEMMYRAPERPYGEAAVEMPAAAAPAAPLDQPAPEKETVKPTGILDEAMMRDLDQDVNAYASQTPERAELRNTTNVTTENAIAEAAYSARNQQGLITTANNAVLNQPDKGALAPGTFQPFRLAAIQGAQDIYNVAQGLPGFPQDLKGLDFGNTEDSVLITKLQSILAFARTNDAMQNNIPALSLALNTIANPKMTKSEAIPIMASQIVANRRPQLAAKYVLDARDHLLRTHPGQDENYNIAKINDGFNKAFPQVFWNKSEKLIERAMNTPWRGTGGGTFYQAMINGNVPQDNIRKWALQNSNNDPLMANFPNVLMGR